MYNDYIVSTYYNNEDILWLKLFWPILAIGMCMLFQMIQKIVIFWY